jgi:hypothetical protein
MAYNPAKGSYGVFALSLQSVNYGDLQGTMRWDNEPGYVETEIFSPSALAVGFGYAKSLTDRFSVGGQIKFTNQYLGNSVIPEGEEFTKKKNLADVIAFDFGTLLNTGYKSLAFGMSIRNYAREVRYETEGFQLPLLFSLGVSMDLIDFTTISKDQHSIVFAIDATHPRDHSEQLKLGVNYTLMQFLSVRAGYTTNNDEDGLTLGLGLSQYGVTIDYAYAPFGVFGDVQRITGRFALN